MNKAEAVRKALQTGYPAIVQESTNCRECSAVFQAVPIASNKRVVICLANELSGSPFLFISFNDAVDWPGLGGLFNRWDYAAAEKYLEKAAASGVTILRVMLEYTHHEYRYFEKPVGIFPRSMVRLWDDIFSLCARFGLRVLLTPFDTFWMSRRWHRHPYNRNVPL